ncbi:MAG: efflux RND transporter permease subunit, partial [Gammaproteobacteria bacterium]
AMPFINISVNQLSLGGLILMLGLLVDDAIVTSESILRHSERGMNARDAAIHGTAAVAPPVITSVATTILAFAPAAFLGGIEGKFMWMAPAMAMLALSASLIECKMLLPSHMHHALSRHTNDGSRFSRSWFDPVEAFYRRQMTRLLPHRYKTMMVFLAIFAGITFLGIKLVNVNLYPDYEVDAFYVQAELPMGSSFDNTREKLEAIDRIVRDIVPPQDLLNISLTVGHHDYDPKEETSGYHSAWGMVSIYLKSIDERESDTLELIRETRQRLKGYGDFTRITVVPQRETPPVGRAVEVEIIGNDDNRYELADTLTRWLRNHPGTTEVWTSHTLGKDVIELQLHHERMADYGLQTSDITTAVRLAFDGLIIDELQTVDERIRYRLQLAKPDQGRLESLRSLPIINHEGKPVPLRAVVDFDIRPGEATIKHYFGDRTLTVFAEIDRDSTSTAEINEELQSYINDHQVLEGYHQLRLHFGGEYEQQSEAVSNVGFAFMLCLAGIVFLLVILFNSATQPFLVLSILPLGLAGVVFAFATHGMDLSMSALTGTIGLMGVLVNDSLVMIDRLNNYRNELPDASHFMTDSDIVNGASQRLRAIFITTTTTVAGLFPAAYGLAGENPFITPMIMAMIWGVLFGSFVTLVYLPCLYAMEQDFRKWLARKTQPTTH